tara:strand:- start:2879 stop:3700 length:822 start_codon:yes stop_codon:yes gene_type:complete
LYIVSTPIGNLEDISIRAKNVLNLVDIIICENPIHSLKLLNKLGIKKKLLSLHDYNEQVLIKRIAKYQNNAPIALISDAGSPLISDPGYKLVLDYIKKNLMITCVPGPSSVIPALQLSGLPVNNFTFHGFVAKNKSGQKEMCDIIKNSNSTNVFFISGSRLINFLNELLNNKVNRKISVCKEMTKMNEKIFRGEIDSVLKNISSKKNNLKGEFVLVIEGKTKEITKKLSPEIEKLIVKLLLKFSLTEVVQIVHKLTSISKNEVYKTVLSIKDD